jgi:hypothetical protein
MHWSRINSPKGGSISFYQLKKTPKRHLRSIAVFFTRIWGTHSCSVVCSRRPVCSYGFTHHSGFKWWTDNTLEFMNIKPETSEINSDEPKSVIILFIKVNFHSHSAVEKGDVEIVLNNDSQVSGISRTPRLSANSLIPWIAEISSKRKSLQIIILLSSWRAFAVVTVLRTNTEMSGSGWAFSELESKLNHDVILFATLWTNCFWLMDPVLIMLTRGSCLYITSFWLPKSPPHCSFIRRAPFNNVVSCIWSSLDNVEGSWTLSYVSPRSRRNSGLSGLFLKSIIIDFSLVSIAMSSNEMKWLQELQTISAQTLLSYNIEHSARTRRNLCDFHSTEIASKTG